MGGSLAAMILPQFQSIAQAKVGNKGVPTRAVYIGMGYGVSKSGWFPEPKAGPLKLTPLLKPLENHIQDVSVIQNLSFKGGATGKAKGHTSAQYFLSDATGIKPKSNTQNALPTCDQIIAKQIGKETPFPSVQIGWTKPNGLMGGHGPGIRSLSWDIRGRHMTGLPGALGMYKAMFAHADLKPQDVEQQFEQKRSVLDFLVKDIKSLNSKLSSNDKNALEQYNQGVREVELNIGRSIEASKQQSSLGSIQEPGNGEDGLADMASVYDMIVLAMQADLSRVFSYILPVETLINSLDLKSKTNTHDMSHQRTRVARAQHAARDKANITMLAKFFDKLKAVRQPDGQSLFDHSMITFGGGLRSHHMRRNLPIVFAGYGGGNIKQGYNVVNQSNKTPLTNLWLSQIRQFDSKMEEFHTSDNVISEVFSA